MEFEVSESNDQSEEDNKCNSDNDSAVKGGVVTIMYLLATPVAML